jgi:hypothetical protein
MCYREQKGDPNWTPLGITPSHPEYPAPTAVSPAVSQLIAGYIRTRKVHVVTDT